MLSYSKSRLAVKNIIKLISVMFIAVILFAGCNKSNNPVDPNGENNGKTPPEIKQPVAMRVKTIAVYQFPENKPDGSKWDFDPIFPINARPDIFVTMNLDGSTTNFFRSKTEGQADYQYSYYFRDAANPNDGTLPHDCSMTSIYKITLSDDDGIWGADYMGAVYFNPGSVYENDNAETFSKSYTYGTVTIGIQGDWIY